MNHAHELDDVPQLTDDYTPPPLRLFEYICPDKSTRLFSAHYYGTASGSLVFYDEERLPNTLIIYRHRRTIAPGQWCEVEERSVAPGGAAAN